jgi:hypothetical protein
MQYALLSLRHYYGVFRQARVAVIAFSKHDQFRFALPATPTLRRIGAFCYRKSGLTGYVT